MDQPFWKQDPQPAAQRLLGKLLIVGSTEAWVLRTEGFSRSQNSTGIYKPILSMPPGDVYCPRSRNSILLLVVTQDGSDTGGCVLIRAAEIGGVVFEGPGKVTEALGITEARTCGKAELADDDTVVLHLGTSLTTVQPKSMSQRVPAARSLGWAVIRRYMPTIAQKFFKQSVRSFEEYLGNLLEGCSSEVELLNRLR